ncbi:hypothetical protein H6F89_29350 [Cyanobacteria bacterium FACHB-63]|nr:hypothetical protein [Cyanobacteria bacterium FACHB-63]
MTKLLEPQEIQVLLRDWGLSERAISILIKEPEVVANLQEARSLSPFSPDYVPCVIEELFDDIPFRRWEQGKSSPIYERPCSADYDPPFVEYSFDGQTALFHVQGEIVVNRMELMSDFAQQIAELNEALEE